VKADLWAVVTLERMLMQDGTDSGVLFIFVRNLFLLEPAPRPHVPLASLIRAWQLARADPCGHGQLGLKVLPVLVGVDL
jgi:hypothetical protein